MTPTSENHHTDPDPRQLALRAIEAEFTQRPVPAAAPVVPVAAPVVPAVGPVVPGAAGV